jgi:hypothetical protein
VDVAAADFAGSVACKRVLGGLVAGPRIYKWEPLVGDLIFAEAI